MERLLNGAYCRSARLAQDSGLGVTLGPLTASAIGQADDCALVSNDLFYLSCLLRLTFTYDGKYLVDLCADKTRLQVFSKTSVLDDVTYNPIRIDDKEIPFSSTADHVGILRSTSGNLPTLLARA